MRAGPCRCRMGALALPLMRRRRDPMPTARGLQRGVLGEFHGPMADEDGRVFIGASDVHGVVLVG